MPAGELVEQLARFVPALLARRLADAPHAPPVARAESFPAAALLADITGSTALAEHLARRGPAGAEELSRLLNAALGQLIDIITAHGGDVAKFAGDGLLALWPTEDAAAALALATRRAAQCGMLVQARLHGQPLVDGIGLTLRVGIGAGTAHLVHVGGVADRWEWLATGTAVTQAGAAEHRAPAGRVALSAEAWEHARTACTGEPLAPGAVCLQSVHQPAPTAPLAAPDLPPAAVGRLRAYAPEPVLARLDAGQSEWLAELRAVTVLFIALPGLDCTTDLQRAHTAMRALQTEVARYEGTIARLGADARGPLMLAVLGLPPRAHEDDGARAVLAAQAIRTALHALATPCAIGVATGRLFCGTTGNRRRCEYTVIGDVANLAARLAQASGTDILCDAATAHAAARRVHFTALPAISVKGKSEPIALFRPGGQVEPPAAPTPSPLIGRRTERDALAAALERLVHDGSGGTVILEGDAGMGKSLLIETLLGTAAGRTGTLLGSGVAVEAASPYHAWRPVFARLFDLDALPPDPAARRERVLEQLHRCADDPDDAAHLRRLAPLLNLVLPFDLPESDLTAQLDGQARADNAHELLVRVLDAAAAGAPMLLVIEDAHWLDSASWALVRLVRRRVQRLLLVLATRPLAEPVPPEYRELLQAPEAQRLPLAALPADDALALACDALHVAALPEPVAALITQRAAGHPFFSKQLAYALRDTGQLVVRDGECRVAATAGDLRALQLPDTVQGIITSRIDRLAPRQQLVLKVASVIGQVFPAQLLHDVFPIAADRPHLDEELRVLDQLDLTPLAAPAPDAAYAFKHSLIRETVYDLLPFAQRRQLHRAVAEWLERVHAGDLAAHAPLLAHHWNRVVDAADTPADLLEKAVAYGERAAEQARHSHANHEVVHFLGGILAVEARLHTQAGRLDPAWRLRRARWHRQLGEASFALGRPPEARASLQTALELSGHAVPRTTPRLTAGLAGAVGRQILHRLVPAAFVARAQPAQREALLEAARAYEALSLVWFIAMERLPSTFGNLRGLNLAESAGSCGELANSYAMIGLLTGLLSQPRLARRYFQRAFDTAERLGERFALGRAWYTHGLYLVGQAQWTEAEAALRQALGIFEGVGDLRWRELSLLTMGNISQGRSRFRQALSEYDTAAASARRRGDVQAQAWATVGIVGTRLMLGEHDHALRDLDTMTSWLQNDFGLLADRASEIGAHGIRALAHARRGETSPALAAAETAWRLIERSPVFAYYAVTGYSTVTEVGLTLWEHAGDGADRERAMRLAKQTLPRLRKFARLFPLGVPQAWLCQGMFDWLRRRPARAHAAWRKSLAAAEHLQVPYEAARAHQQIGLHTDARDPARRAHLRRAEELFAELDAAFDLAQTRAALES